MTVHIAQGRYHVPGFLVTYAGVTDPGRIRRGNEDDFLLLPEAGVFAVADGLGGLDAGDVASSTTLAHLRDLCSNHPLLSVTGAAGSRLATVIATVNNRTYARRITLGNTMATTLALVLLGADSSLAAHVGDSRIYRWRDGVLGRITSDHSLVNELYEHGILTASQAELSPQRHVITRAVGAGPTVQPSIQPITTAHGDILVLCTDGLTNMVQDAAIAACLQRETTDVRRIAEQLVHLANEAGGHDNITVVVVALAEDSSLLVG